MQFHQRILLGCRVEESINLWHKVATEMEISCDHEVRLEDFLLAIQDKDYHAIVIDLELFGADEMKMIRLVHHMRPKIPVITMVKNLDTTIGGQLYNEGVSHILVTPPCEETIRTALMTIPKAVSKFK
ncbi:hypothetical protein JW960_05270 [candidate division KSB1 bacterium]|nr:hypothetical protein [candidate division KSB1 bacterium]